MKWWWAISADFGRGYFSRSYQVFTLLRFGVNIHFVFRFFIINLSLTFLGTFKVAFVAMTL